MFVSWNLGDLNAVLKVCGRNKICIRTGKEHVSLICKDPATKTLKTKIAEPYPEQLCRDIVSYIANQVSKPSRLKADAGGGGCLEGS